jgi:hypothetical protein
VSARKPFEWPRWPEEHPDYAPKRQVRITCKAPGKPKARLAASVPAGVARFIVRHGTQTAEPPPGVPVTEYRDHLAQLVKQGVLKVWEWGQEFDTHYQPELAGLAGRYLYLAGPKWATFRATVEK